MYFSCIRHGRTQMNVEDLVCGVTDIPLVELGIQQAKNASEDIYKKIQKGELPKIDLIFSSPLLRAQQTAQIIAEKLNLTYQIEERLTEQNYGKMEGCSRFDEKYLAIRSQFAVKYPEGESMLDVAQRVYNFIDEVKKNTQNSIIFYLFVMAEQLDLSTHILKIFLIKNLQILEQKIAKFKLLNCNNFE